MTGLKKYSLSGQWLRLSNVIWDIDLVSYMNRIKKNIDQLDSDDTNNQIHWPFTQQRKKAMVVILLQDMFLWCLNGLGEQEKK